MGGWLGGGRGGSGDKVTERADAPILTFIDQRFCTAAGVLGSILARLKLSSVFLFYFAG